MYVLNVSGLNNILKKYGNVSLYSFIMKAVL